MAIRKRTGKYWEQRSLERLDEAERTSLKHIQRIYDVYDESQRRTVQSVRRMYSAYYSAKGWDATALKSIAPTGDVNRFLDDMRAAGLDTVLPDNYKGRMTRLELLNAQMWGETKKTALRHGDIETAAHAETIHNAYYRTIFDTSKGIGSTPVFNNLNTQTVNRLLNTKFLGKNYSERIWSNTNVLADQLKSTISTAIATGQPPANTIREIARRFDVSRYEAQRLVQTETNFFENATEIEAYDQMGIEKYVFLATLDKRTSLICREHDGKIYSVKDVVMGGNVPPLHPWCRSTVRPYLGKEYEPKTRIARNTDGKNTYVTNMSYNEWEKLFVHDVSGIVGPAKVAGVAGSIVNTNYGAAYETDSLWGINSDILADTATQAEQLLNAYEPVQKWAKDQGGMIIRAGELQRGTMATTLRAKPVVTLSRAYYQDPAKLSKTIEKGIKVGHAMPAKDYTGYAFNHEFGHVVENYLLRARNTDAAANAVRRDIIGIAKSKFDLSDDEVINLISGYGKQNSREFFGEAFANLHSGKPNKIGRAMEEYLKGALS